MAGLPKRRSPQLVGIEVLVGPLQRHNLGHIHMERHERAEHVQRPGDHIPERRASPERLRAPQRAQHVRHEPNASDIQGPSGALHVRASAVHPDTRDLRGLAALRSRVDGRQHCRLGAPQDLHTHVPLVQRRWHVVRRRRHRWLLQEPRYGVDGAMVPGGRLSAFLPITCSY